MFFYIVSWIATLMHIVFATLSLAAGLYYIAEVVEEYTVATAKCIKYMIFFTMLVNAGLYLFEGLPLYLTGVGLLTSVDHLLLLNEFPNISLTSLSFLVSVVMVFVNHYFSFKYFGIVYHVFPEIIAYFTICQWLVPFSFFVSLSINESTLPTTNTMINPSSDDMFAKPKRTGLLGLFDYLFEKKDRIKQNLTGREHLY